ncbi:MAG: RecX family transcriptional regulator [Dehalococcoidales bacterium]|nr:MAG: RecX family transcriptional regulator [Dehalococcoidales bacterium]
MKKITALRAGKGRSKRVRIFLDGKQAFYLETEVVAKEGLKVGQRLSADQINILIRKDNFQRALGMAVHYISYRPRSEFELRERLGQRGTNDRIQEEVIAKLKEQGLVDDTAFARFWTSSRESYSPRSQWLTGLELKRRGVADDIVNKVVDNIDDEDSAYRAALKKARSLPQSDYAAFRRRLGSHLQRRGFGYGIIKHTIQRLWQEQVSY